MKIVVDANIIFSALIKGKISLHEYIDAYYDTYFLIFIA